MATRVFVGLLFAAYYVAALYLLHHFRPGPLVYLPLRVGAFLLAGVVVAAVYYWLVRETPEQGE